MCTIASTPRLPEHCVEYAKVFQWPEEKPFGGVVLYHFVPFTLLCFALLFSFLLSSACSGVGFTLLFNYINNIVFILDAQLVVDGDNPNHIKWIYDKALERSKEYNIKGVTYRLTQGIN